METISKIDQKYGVGSEGQDDNGKRYYELECKSMHASGFCIHSSPNYARHQLWFCARL